MTQPLPRVFGLLVWISVAVFLALIGIGLVWL